MGPLSISIMPEARTGCVSCTPPAFFTCQPLEFQWGARWGNAPYDVERIKSLTVATEKVSLKRRLDVRALSSLTAQAFGRREAIASPTINASWIQGTSRRRIGVKNWLEHQGSRTSNSLPLPKRSDTRVHECQSG